MTQSTEFRPTTLLQPSAGYRASVATLLRRPESAPAPEPNGGAAGQGSLGPTVALACDRVVRHFRGPAPDRYPLVGLHLMLIGTDAAAAADWLRACGAAVVVIGSGADASTPDDPTALGSPAIIEDFVAAGQVFDAVVVLDVTDVSERIDRFFEACCAVLAQGGIFIAAAVNRSLRARVIAATRRFGYGARAPRPVLAPEDLSALLENRNVLLTELIGVDRRPLTGRLRVSDDVAGEYLAVSVRPPLARRHLAA